MYDACVCLSNGCMHVHDGSVHVFVHVLCLVVHLFLRFLSYIIEHNGLLHLLCYSIIATVSSPLQFFHCLCPDGQAVLITSTFRLPFYCVTFSAVNRISCPLGFHGSNGSFLV